MAEEGFFWILVGGLDFAKEDCVEAFVIGYPGVCMGCGGVVQAYYECVVEGEGGLGGRGAFPFPGAETDRTEFL